MNRAKMFIGSKEVDTKTHIEVQNPFNKKVVSSYPICFGADVIRALNLAKEASKEAKKSPFTKELHG